MNPAWKKHSDGAYFAETADRQSLEAFRRGTGAGMATAWVARRDGETLGMFATLREAKAAAEKAAERAAAWDGEPVEPVEIETAPAPEPAERVSYTRAARELRAAGLRVSRDADGEIRVGFPGNESAAYYCTDPADALATGLDMVARAAAGATVSPDAEGEAIERGEHVPGEPWDAERAAIESGEACADCGAEIDSDRLFPLCDSCGDGEPGDLESAEARLNGAGEALNRAEATGDPAEIERADAEESAAHEAFREALEAEARAGESRQARRARERAEHKRATRPGPFHGTGTGRSLSAATVEPERRDGAAIREALAVADSTYADLSRIEPGESVAVLVSTMGKAWERKPLVFHRLPDRDGAPVYRVTSPGGTLDSGPLPAETLEPVAHRTFQAWIKATAGAWAWRIESHAVALVREYAGARRRLARSGRGPSAREALERARRTLETGGASANPFGPWRSTWSGLGGSAGRVFSAYGESRVRWIEDPESVGLRLVGLAHEAAPAGHAYARPAVESRGWYLDEYGGETVSGVVYRLPGRDGRARFLYGYADPWNADSSGRGPALLSLEIVEGDRRDSDWDAEPALRDAAQRADAMAESMAERERAYQDGWQAGREARESAAEALEAGKALVRLCRDARTLWRARGGSPALPGPMARAALREALEAVREARAAYLEARETARELRDDSPSWETARDGWRDGYAEGV